MPRISLIAALGMRTRAIGRDNALLWRIPGDLPRFRALTTGHPIIMGYNTFLSIGKPLPNRTNIVLTTVPDWSHEGVLVCHDMNDALTLASTHDTEEVFVIGGGSVYTQMIGRADRLYLTLVDDDTDGDTFFPEYAHLPFTEVAREERDEGGLRFAWVTLERT